MIELRKPELKLPNLDGNDAVLAEKKTIETWLVDGTQPAPKFPKFWLRPDVKGAVIAQQGWNCAFCQGRASAVDHFRPIRGYAAEAHSGYPWLAYSWSNLLFICTACNSKKGSRFPLRNPGSRATHPQRETKVEEPLLLNPLMAEAGGAFEIELGESPAAFRIKTKTGHPLFDQAAHTLEILDLDGYGRSDMKDGIAKYLMAEGFRQLDATASSSPYSWVARHLTGRAPSPEDDLLFLLMRILADIQKLEGYAEVDRVRKGSSGQDCEKPYTKLRESRWALATLAFEHPLKGLVQLYLDEYATEATKKALVRYAKKLQKVNAGASPPPRTPTPAQNV